VLARVGRVKVRTFLCVWRKWMPSGEEKMTVSFNSSEMRVAQRNFWSSGAFGS